MLYCRTAEEEGGGGEDDDNEGWLNVLFVDTWS